MSLVSRTTGSTRRVSRGDVVLARDQNATRSALLAIQQLQNQLKQGTARTWAESMLHQIVVVGDDYLECVRVWRNGDLGTETVYVAKPRLLRGTLLTRDAVTYVYTDLVGYQTRTASKVGETDETQIVTPTYLVDDLIEAQVVRGITSVTLVDEQRGSPIDKNVDGRAWAVAPPVTP